ncbi:MAG: glycosyltransferase family 2 protein [Flavobacteriaceae bacterium]|nr:glycosyltransferase family 2 protein [Flavobacteriaceae bacterium]
MKLSVIIVSYNAADFLRNCLISVLKELPTDAEVIVFDNASTDDQIQSFPQEFPCVQFVLNQENRGFAYANNAAVRRAQGEFILILNPDTLVYAGFFDNLLDFAEQKSNLGALGVRMIDGKGRFLPESKRNIPDLISSFSKLFVSDEKSNYYHQSLGEHENGETFVLSGACMLMKKSVYEEVGGFDERYFMYGEDIDLSFTLLKNGYKNYYLGEVSITHFKGESTVKDKKYLERFYGAMEIFLIKYYKKQRPLQYYLMLVGLKFKYWKAKKKFQKSGLIK